MYQERLDISGRSAVVTGGARGIGLAIVTALHEFGVKVLIVDLLDEEGLAAAMSLGMTGSAVHYVHADVRKETEVAAAFAFAASVLPSIEIVVTSAGVAWHGDSDTVTESDWRLVFDTNVDGTFWTAQQAVRHLTRGGSVVTIGSMSGIIVNHPQWQTAYNASKAAVHSLTASLAIEHAKKGIRFNSVAPGYIGTDLTQHVRADWLEEWNRLSPVEHMGTPQDVASLVAFLASDAAAFITGATISIDGGYTAW